MDAPKLKSVIRLDSFPLNQTFFTPEGYLRDRPILTRTGIFEYLNPDGSTRRELRLPEEVFNADSLASYKGKPIIISHDAGLIDKDNVHEQSIGTILSEGYRSEDNVRAEIVIHDADAMRESRLRELSLGYNLDLDETPGVWNGQPYDAVQRNIRVNHLALVSEARAGDKARLNIDGRSSTNSLKGGKAMNNTHKKTRRADGILSPEELEQAIAEYKAKHSAAAEPAAEDGEEEEVVAAAEETAAPEAPEKNQDEEPAATPAGEETPIEEQVAELKGKKQDADDDTQKLFDIIDTLLAEREFKAGAEEKKADEGEEQQEAPVVPAEEQTDGAACETNEDEDDDEIPTTEEGDVEGTMNMDAIDRIVRERIRVGMIGKSLNLDGLENLKLRDAKKTVVKAVRPTMNLDGKSPAFINAAYEMACAEVISKSKKDTGYQKRQMFNRDGNQVAQELGGSADAARERMIARRNKNNND